ncbi:MAG: urease accessory protein UreE [Synechococcaceae cyanobacterium]|nr:urease accessory protein UreE [Synechococcaceae cyanobacterium]
MAEEFPNPPTLLLLTRRLDEVARGAGAAGERPPLRLALAAAERSSLRGRRQSLCGRALLLQLPRGDALRPGEWLAPEQGGPLVRVEAAPEALLVVRAADPLALLQAAYHLGNRHVALELRERELRLSEDPVLADLLSRRGLLVEQRHEPFLPEAGAYAGIDHSHSRAAGHSHGDGPDRDRHGHSADRRGGGR